LEQHRDGHGIFFSTQRKAELGREKQRVKITKSKRGKENLDIPFYHFTISPFDHFAILPCKAGVISAVTILAFSIIYIGRKDSCDPFVSARHEFFSSLKILVNIEMAMTKITPDLPFVSPFHLSTFPLTFQPFRCSPSGFHR